jgi:hypothetical protein
MPTVLQFRRGTSAQNDSFTGAAGEVSIDTDSNSIRIHDGATAGGVEIAGNLTAGATSGNGISGSASSGTFTVTSNATNANTASTIVLRDGSGNFSAGTITASLSGNATTATTASGVTANSVALGTDTTGNYVQQGATSGNGISGSVNSEGGTFTVTSNAVSENTASTIVFRDSSGNFSAGTITATASSAQYADLAENYLADIEYPIGTVLEIGGDAEVTIASPDSYKVVGTISEAPGYLMNSELEGEHVVPVAYIGRVPCRVQGTVNRGDFLVVGNTPGVAVAKHPIDILSGQAIGKALESHIGNEEGIIEILVGRL